MTIRLFGSSGAAIAQYHGSSQTTQSCLDAIARLLAAGTTVNRALLLSSGGWHGFYLDCQDPEPVFIRCGFSSGYSGEGSAGLAIALHLLRRFGVDVEEVVVPADLLVRLDENRLTIDDLDLVSAAPVVRPMRIYDYQYDGINGRGASEGLMRAQFRNCVPWSTVDERLVDLAFVLEREPDRAVFEAFRRLESTVSKRIELPLGTSGIRVFQIAFRSSGARLTWSGLPKTEIDGRAQLFEAAFSAYRNALAHREEDRDEARAYREFFIVNELFLLEAEAVEVVIA